jgi:hypothetical protein
MPDLDRLFGALTRLVNAVVCRVDYYAVRRAKVISQASNGNLEVVLDGSVAPMDVQVPVRGLPGVAVKVAKGARVLITYEDGDPRQPIATLFEPSSLTELTVTASTKVTVNAPDVRLADGTGRVVRDGDIVLVPTAGTPGPITLVAAMVTPPVLPPGILIGTASKVKA